VWFGLLESFFGLLICSTMEAAGDWCDMLCFSPWYWLAGWLAAFNLQYHEGEAERFKKLLAGCNS